MFHFTWDTWNVCAILDVAVKDVWGREEANVYTAPRRATFSLFIFIYAF